MRKSEKICLILTLALLLLSLWLFLSSIAESAEIEYIRAGWTSPASGYYMTDQAGRDILAGWSSDRAAKETYKAALDDLYAEWQTFKGDMSAQIAEIKEAHTKERQEWQKALRQARSPGLGVFAGAGYTTGGEVQGVVGVGLVWKVF